MRYFWPSQPFTAGLSADLNDRAELGGGQLDLRFSVSGLDTQRFGVTYSRQRAVLSAQYDRTVRLDTAQQDVKDATLVVFAQQGFAAQRGVQSVSVTGLYTSSQNASFAYRLLSADLGLSGALSSTWNWTAGAGVSRTDSGTQAAYTARSLAYRARASVNGRLGRLGRPTTLGVQANWDGQASQSLLPDAPESGPLTSRYAVNATVSQPLTEKETLSISARLDNKGSYSADLGLSSSRTKEWSLGAGLNVSGQAAWAEAEGQPAALGWNASASRAPKPWGVRLAYAGSSGEAGTHTLDGEVQYQQGTLNVQLGAGVSLQGQGDTRAPAYRGSLGLSFQPRPAETGSGPGSGTGAAGQWRTQLRLSANANPTFQAGQERTYRFGVSLSGSASYEREPYSLSFSSTLAYSPWNAGQPWTGEVDLQGLYRVTPKLQLNGSARYRPGTVSSYQAGIGLRYSF